MCIFPRITAVLTAVAATVVTVVAPAEAAPEDYDIFLPAGVGCEGFGLGIDVSGGNRIIREFTDNEGNVVRILETGKGSDLTFTNDATGSSIVLRSNGSVSDTTFNSDGTRTVVNLGHNVVIFFPSDVPAGPSTKQYVGRLVYTVDSAETFELQGFSGGTTDICERLSS
jgi:hypothetical protein